jgi:hypothetical protein
MSLKEWIINLPDGFHVVVRRRYKRGDVAEFAVVLVYDDQCISRYDTADGAPHRDVLGDKQGLIDKVWYESLSNKEVFQNAIEDFEHNYRSHLAFFHRH